MKNLLLVLAALVLSMGPAHAYLDPGTGSVLLQGLLAGALAVGAFWRNIKQWVKGLFHRDSIESIDSVEERRDA